MNAEGTIHKLYTSFPIRDWKTMQSCYHPLATFSDPVFPDLSVKEVKAMWHMLNVSATDLKIIFSDVVVNGERGSCRWQAWYKFNGRDVHNIIDASFVFKDGLIFRHTDRFDLWRWSRMALGITGVLLGWSPFVRNKVRTTARRRLNKFIMENPQYK